MTTWLQLRGGWFLGPARTAAYGYRQPFMPALTARLLIGEPVLPLLVPGGVVMLLGVISGQPRAPVRVLGPALAIPRRLGPRAAARAEPDPGRP